MYFRRIRRADVFGWAARCGPGINHKYNVIKCDNEYMVVVDKQVTGVNFGLSLSLNLAFCGFKAPNEKSGGGR